VAPSQRKEVDQKTKESELIHKHIPSYKEVLKKFPLHVFEGNKLKHLIALGENGKDKD